MDYMCIHKYSEDNYDFVYRDADGKSRDIDPVKIVRFLDECIDSLMKHSTCLVSGYRYVELDAGVNAHQ